jgi:excisionase family DNA binding protein
MERKQGYLNISEASRWLSLPKSRLYNLTFRKTIPFYKLGRTVLFRQEELEKYMLSMRVEPARTARLSE